MKPIVFFMVCALGCLNCKAGYTSVNNINGQFIGDLDVPMQIENTQDLGLESQPVGQSFNENIAITPVQSVITGTVQFEPRYTRVIDLSCEDFPCEKSKVYWVMMISSGTTRYMLNHQINLGIDIAPKHYQVAGVLLREGFRIQLDADVIHTSSKLSVMVEVKGVTVLAE